MPLSWRVYVGVAVLVFATTALAFLTTGRGVLGPFNDRVFDAFLGQAVYVAEQVEQGVRPEAVGQRMGLDVTLRRGPHPADRRGRNGSREVVTVARDGREIRYRQGPRNRVQVRTDRGWVMVRRELDLDRPRRNLVVVLLGGGLLVGIAGTWLVRASLRPLDAAIRAMRRVADGDLTHRIPAEGPPELREVATAFHRMTDRIEALTQADRQLVAGVSHEIRTPLARMRLRLELLSDELGEHPRIADLRHDLHEIDQLVGELVTLSRLQLGGFRLERVRVPLAELVEAAAEGSDLDPARLERGGEGATVDVDRGLAVRAIANVLKNAHRYAPTGPVRITLRQGTVTIEDEGPGIPEAELEQVFAPFVRGTGQEPPNPSGLGLGLMIVAQVMDLHDGRVTVANRPDGGLRVTLHFPLEPAASSTGQRDTR